MEHDAQIVIITGMSGAGKSEAMHVFEDLGYHVIDALPPEMIPQLIHIMGLEATSGRRLAVVCDLRSQGLFDELLDVIAQLRDQEISCSLLFLDAEDETLRRRYTLTRRKNPIAQDGESTISAIERERSHLQAVKDQAEIVIDTTNLTAKQLQANIKRTFSERSARDMLDVQVFSFGYKYGLPHEADLMIDVRFLPNPYWDEKLRPLSGFDKPIQDYVLNNSQTKAFLDAWFNLLDAVMPGYVAEGKAVLSIAVGCSGGRHRSVILAEKTVEYLQKEGYHTNVAHRDIDHV